jgi:hypothetical protein
MTTEPTDKELKLADRVNELSEAAARPVVTGGGLFAQAVNFLMRRVSRGMITTALIFFIGYHGWEAFNGALQSTAKLQGKRAEVGSVIAEITALNTQTKNGNVALDKVAAEIDLLQQQAASIQAEADAQNKMIGDASVSLRTIRAQIAKTEAEAQAARVEVHAQTQRVDDMSINVAQKKAEVETLENQAKAIIAGQRADVSKYLNYIARSQSLCRGGFC